MLKELRKDRGLTQAALAARAGLPLRTVQKYESGEYKPENMTLGNALKLAAALGCEPGDLVEGIDEDIDIYLIYKDDIDDAAEIVGYIRGSSDEADLYCNEYNAKCEYYWQHVTWVKIDALPVKIPTK